MALNRLITPLACPSHRPYESESGVSLKICAHLVTIAVRLFPVGPERGLIYRVRTLREQERQPVALLEPYLPRSEDFVTICAWCERVAVPAHGWLEIEAAIAVLPALAEPRPPQLTHGICEACAQVLYGALSEEPVSAALAQL